MWHKIISFLGVVRAQVRLDVRCHLTTRQHVEGTREEGWVSMGRNS